MNRCTKCILPLNYPGITFNNEGICNHCLEYKDRDYLGSKALKNEIENFLKTKKCRNKDYDILLGISGGRDSTYLLYYLTEVLNMKVLAYTVDNGFVVPEQPKINMKNATDKLNIKLIVEKNDLLEKCVKHTISAWIKRPSLSMIEVFCTGCRHPVVKGMINFAKKENIPIIIRGGTPFELVQYKFNIMKIKRRPELKLKAKKAGRKGGDLSLVKGYLSEVIQNPKWVMNRNYLMTQAKDYYYFFNEFKMTKEAGLLKIRPFFNYIRWEEKKVVDIIENKLDWEKTSITESTWRGDCDIAFLKLYIYKKLLGFNDKVDGLSHLVRDNQITRKEALERLKKEAEIPEEALHDILDGLDINYSDFKTALRKLQKQMAGNRNY